MDRRHPRFIGTKVRIESFNFCDTKRKTAFIGSLPLRKTIRQNRENRQSLTTSGVVQSGRSHASGARAKRSTPKPNPKRRVGSQPTHNIRQLIIRTHFGGAESPTYGDSTSNASQPSITRPESRTYPRRHRSNKARSTVSKKRSYELLAIDV